MITIFSIPKPFQDHINIIQTNSIKSWLVTNPIGEIILCGDEIGIKEMANTDHRITHLSNIKKNKNGTPFVSDVFEKIRQLAKHLLICYAASDIILTYDFLKSLQKLPQNKAFFALGRRSDLDITEHIDFTASDWEEKLRSQLKKGRLHGFSAMDLMIFPKTLSFTVPDFLIGRPGWDNALIYQLIKKGIPIIDVTPSITAIHQNHDYSHHKQGKYGVWKGEEAQYNFKLSGGFSRMVSIINAHYLLTKQGLVKPPLLRNIYATMSLWYPVRQLLNLKRQLTSRL